jgi:tRNA (cytidine32/uridine32-2'-O)-methyltransferase
MKNMGLRRLVVVAPASFDVERARWMASGAVDVLISARFVATVGEALVGHTWAVGCTARARRWRWPVYDQDQIAEMAFSPSLHDGLPPRTALLYGREDMGLANEALERCQTILHIETDGAPSINLAQAVLLTCDALRRVAKKNGWDGDERRLGLAPATPLPTPLEGPQQEMPATLEDQSRVVEQALHFLNQTSYMRNKTDPQVRVLLAILLQRSQVTKQELDVIRGMLRKSTWSLQNGPERAD